MQLEPRSRISLTACTMVLALGVGAPSAHATVEAMIFSNIVYAHPQADTYCYARVPVSAMIGIPPAALSEASLAPSYAFRSGSGGPGAGQEAIIDGVRFININELSLSAPIVHTYVNDSFTSAGTVEYTAELDLSQLAAANGQTLEGRKATITRAKLALLALAKNLKDTCGLYRLFVTFKGLPSQTGLPGQPVYASSKWPYTGSSPVLAGYEHELVDPSACGSGSALYGKSDELSGAITEPAEQPRVGCSVGSGAGASGLAGLALLLAGLLALRLRRRARPL